MDIIIDRYGSNIFDDPEIDIICDAIENLLYKEFFENENTLLEIHCTCENDNEWDNVIGFRNKVDPEVRQLGYHVAQPRFDSFYNEVFDYPVPQTTSQSLNIIGTTICLYLISIKLQVGYVYILALANSVADLESCSPSMFGLMLLVCKLLSYRDDSAAKLTNILENGKIRNLDKTTQQSICNKIDHLLSSHL